MDIWTLLRVLVSLGVVFVAIWLLARRVNRGRVNPAANVVTVVSRRAVGPKASVAVVDIDGKRLLLGVTEHGVNLLREADIPAVSFADELDTAAAAEQEGTPTYTPAPQGLHRGTLFSIDTWKSSLAGLRRGLGI